MSIVVIFKYFFLTYVHYLMFTERRHRSKNNTVILCIENSVQCSSDLLREKKIRIVSATAVYKRWHVKVFYWFLFQLNYIQHYFSLKQLFLRAVWKIKSKLKFFDLLVYYFKKFNLTNRTSLQTCRYKALKCSEPENFAIQERNRTSHQNFSAWHRENSFESFIFGCYL